MTRARERAYDEMQGHREPVAALYALMIIGLGGLMYAPWLVAALSWITRLV